LNGKESSTSTTPEQGDLKSKEEEMDLPARIGAEDEAEAEFQRLVTSVPLPIRHMVMQMTRLQGGVHFRTLFSRSSRQTTSINSWIILMRTTSTHTVSNGLAAGFVWRTPSYSWPFLSSWSFTSHHSTKICWGIY